MMTRLRGRVERLEGLINTSSKAEKHKAWQAASDDAFHLGHEALILSILDMDHRDVLRRLRRFCEGENVKVLTAATLKAIGGAFDFSGDERVDLTAKHLREEVPPGRWEYEVTGEQFER